TIELLQAILNNWTILQRSSVHALQSTFLQKQGRLKKTGTDWDLLIERDSAVEILIDKLPWGISMVKLPWNNFMILTQW
ncbi:MAG TPA: contractile injection system tape measure protein, partial [Bacteroidia bacterium]|nr:contractile injection system tape measure protein [Bacteroidia bacterium]